MRAKQPLLTLFLISGYFAIAVLIVVYLVIQASSGAYFGSNQRSFKVVLQSAPGITANKSDVLNPAGVRVGVVKEVQGVDAGVAVTLQLNEPLPIHEDGYAEVVTKTILGEKSVVVHPGTKSKPAAANNAQLSAAANATGAEPSAALNPIAGAVDKLAPVDTGALVKQMRTEIVPVLGETDQLLTQLHQMGTAFADVDGAGGRVLERMNSLMTQLSDHGDDLASVVQSLSILTADLGRVVSENLDQLDDVLLLTSRLSNIVATHDAQIGAVLDRMPSYLDTLTRTLDNLTRMFRQDHGFYVRAQVSNLPTVGHWLEILKAGR
ncbi:MAG: MlaD family protein [Acidimicrobiia bacterium]